jgi:hypothetical protein
MHKYYIFISFASLIFLGTVFLTFSQIGLPWEIRGRNLDTARVSDFQNIYYSVQSYAGVHKALPLALSELSNANRIKDPQSGAAYEYRVTNIDSFELCTEFATSSPAKPLYDYPPYNSSQHKKGYDCLNYTITNLTPASNTLPQSVPDTSPQSFGN